MFGYVQANMTLLDSSQLERYRSVYCGVCRSLRENHGQLSGTVLQFDMVFLVMLLSSVYEQDEAGARSGEGRCLPHPLKKRPWIRLPYTDYAADMNLYLGYYNFLDNWKDDRSFPSFTASEMMKREAAAVAQKWPAQCEAVRNCLDALSVYEQQGGTADETSDCFGKLMGELFAVEGDLQWSGTLRRMGSALGKFIYLMDAALDLHSDLKKCRYNPLTSLTGSDFLPLLNMLMGECTAEYEKLALNRDKDILDNILYSGVWTRYNIRKNKNEKRKEGKTF